MAELLQLKYFQYGGSDFELWPWGLTSKTLTANIYFNFHENLTCSFREITTGVTNEPTNKLADHNTSWRRSLTSTHSERLWRRFCPADVQRLEMWDPLKRWPLIYLPPVNVCTKQQILSDRTIDCLYNNLLSLNEKNKIVNLKPYQISYINNYWFATSLQNRVTKGDCHY